MLDTVVGATLAVAHLLVYDLFVAHSFIFAWLVADLSISFWAGVKPAPTILMDISDDIDPRHFGLNYLVPFSKLRTSIF